VISFWIGDLFNNRQSFTTNNLGETEMIEVDYGPGVLGGIILVAFLAPIVYGLFIDRIKGK
jgi:hypothetical protein